MKPSSDIALATTTLPALVLVSLMLFLRSTWDVPLIRSGAFQAAVAVIKRATILPEKDHLALKVCCPSDARRGAF